MLKWRYKLTFEYGGLGAILKDCVFHPMGPVDCLGFGLEEWAVGIGSEMQNKLEEGQKEENQKGNYEVDWEWQKPEEWI